MRWMFGLIALLGLATALVATPISLENLAGDYFYGDGLGVNRWLSVYSNGTYSYMWRGCLGVYANTSGRVSLDEEGVAFFGPHEEGGEGGLGLRFQVVRWGERTYLVHADEIMKLVEGINRGDEPRSRPQGWIYLRDGDWERPADGAPDLPAAYADLIRPRP